MNDKKEPQKLAHSSDKHKTTKPWFSHFLRYPVNKWRGLILIKLKPGNGTAWRWYAVM